MIGRRQFLGTGLLALAALAAQPVFAIDQAVLDAEQRRVAVVEKVAPTVVAVFGAAGGGGGSGVLITADGYALTNFHVSSGAGDFMKCGLNNGELYDAVIVGIDPTGDVALIKLLGRDDFPVATMGDSDKVAVGDWAYAMGNPFLLATDFQPTVTFGIVSGVHRYQYPEGAFLEYTDCIQTDSSINPGNSGGPLFSETGELIGINGRGSFEKRGRVNSGAGYAISINQIKNFMGHLRGGRIVDHATLGAAVSSQSDGSVTVTQILEESEAYRRGMRVGDEIVSFAGRPIHSVNQFKNIIGIYPDEWKLPLVFRHEEQKTEILVRLRALHRESELLSDDGPFPRQRPEEPKPEEKRPDDNDPKKAPPDGPDGKKPAPQLPPGFKQPPPPPEKYKHMLVKEDGYANFYFNKLEQDRLFARLKVLGDFSAATGAWSLIGKTKTNEPVEFMLSDAAATLELGKEIYIQQLKDEFKDEPPNTGGLLVAMHHLRKMLANGPGAFDEVYYLGQEPLDGTGKLVDVLVATLGSSRSRWYFDTQSDGILGFDTRLSDDAEECEVRVLEWRDQSGKKVPSQISVRSAAADFATMTFEKIEFKSSAGKEAAKSAEGDRK